VNTFAVNQALHRICEALLGPAAADYEPDQTTILARFRRAAGFADLCRLRVRAAPEIPEHAVFVLQEPNEAARFLSQQEAERMVRGAPLAALRATCLHVNQILDRLRGQATSRRGRIEIIARDLWRQATEVCVQLAQEEGLTLSPPGEPTITQFRESQRAVQTMLAWCDAAEAAAAGRGEAAAAEGKKAKGKKKPLEKSNPLKAQVYDRIRREHRAGEQYADTLSRLKEDKDFVQQVAEAGLGKPTHKLIRNAVECFKQRERQARKNQAADSA
jgi:hypothetical protein